MSLISKNWINEVYISLTDTLANTDHKISSGITKKTFSAGEKITADSLNALVSSISGLSSNYFLKNYATCFTDNEALNNVNAGALIES